MTEVNQSNQTLLPTDALYSESRKKFGDLINSSVPVLVDFYTEWCGPCTIMKPRLKELKSLIGAKAYVININCDKNVNVTQHYGITSVPTLIIFKEGKLLWQESGSVSIDTLHQLIEQFQK
jgi:thioredoxin 1